jgi:hypothetical protein
MKAGGVSCEKIVYRIKETFTLDLEKFQKALVMGEKGLEVSEKVPFPTPLDEDVIVKIECVGINPIVSFNQKISLIY